MLNESAMNSFWVAIAIGVILILLLAIKIIQDTLQKGTLETRSQVKDALIHQTDDLTKRIDMLASLTEMRLKEINQHVEKRLTDGFTKTTDIFSNVMQRLALIDAAQKKMADLSGSVTRLQDILNDKRSRGAFGEVQLSALIRNVIPEQHFSLQHTLSNGKRADCFLILPEPTGNIAIDAKFPLENFRILMNTSLSENERRQTEQQFRIDIKKHIQDIAEKYIVPGETAEGAMMFLPAEAIFTEIHSHYPELIDFAHRAKVWLVSPTTMMAVLNTARAVLKDAATRQQLHIIQKHLHLLSKDFERFQYRMDQLAKHIAQANADVDQVNTSARKITERFGQIEKVELLDNLPHNSLLEPENIE